MSASLRFGLIGVGRAGVDLHYPGITAAGSEVVALADVAPGRAARWAARLGVARAYEDYRELLACGDIDAVAISTPPVAHLPNTLDAFAAGKHVYLEKPPTMNAAEMEAILTAKPAGVRLLVGSHHIYSPDVRDLARRIAAGELGAVYLAESLQLDRRRLPMGWLRKKEIAGGGVGMDIAVHPIEHMLFVLGEPAIASVTGQTYRYFAAHPSRGSYEQMDVAEGSWRDPEVMDTEDTIVGMVHFQNGSVFIFRSSYAANMPPERQFRVYGSTAGATLHPYVLYGETPAGELFDQRLEPPATDKAPHANAFRHLIACIREGRDTESSGQRALQVMRILDAVYWSSAHGGQAVSWD